MLTPETTWMCLAFVVRSLIKKTTNVPTRKDIPKDTVDTTMNAMMMSVPASSMIWKEEYKDNPECHNDSYGQYAINLYMPPTCTGDNLLCIKVECFTLLTTI